MKISSNQVFIADIRRVSDFIKLTNNTARCPSELLQQNVIVVKFGNLYAPIKNCRSMIAYLALKKRANKAYELSTDNKLLYDFAIGKGRRFVTNFRPLFDEEKVVTLKQLYKMQKENELIYSPSINDLEW